MNRLLRNLTLGVVCSGLGLWLACDSATPTAPSGTILTITASPSQISLNGTSQITVIGRRPDGNPLNPGTEVFFSTNLGSITPAVTTVDGAGVATATLRGDGRVGTANVVASVTVNSGGGGGGEGGEGGGSSTGIGTAAIEVLVGRAAGNVSIQATPTSISEEFGNPNVANETMQIQLLALVRDDQGQPLADATVNFSTEVGSLQSGGAFINTNSSGQARDTLVVSEADVNTVLDDNFEVEAEAASGSAELRSDTATISILRLPEARFAATPNQLTVSFEDQSTGNPTSWRWQFGDGDTSQSQNPSHTYASAGTYTVTLTVTNAAGSSEFSRNVTVSNNT